MTSYWPATNHTRPALLGYFLEIFFTTPAQQADTRRQLTDFATREGYVLHSIVFERLDTRPAAFERLVELAKRDNVTTVAISSPADLDVGQRQRLAVDAGAHVVVAGARLPESQLPHPLSTVDAEAAVELNDAGTASGC